METPARTVKRAKSLRKALTLPEVLHWKILTARHIGGWKFRRQHPKGRYVLDFYCDALKLAVEVDGAIHGYEGNPQRDARRDAWLRLCGIETLRIPAREALFNRDGVHRLLQARTAARAAHLGLAANGTVDRYPPDSLPVG